MGAVQKLEVEIKVVLKHIQLLCMKCLASEAACR